MDVRGSLPGGTQQELFYAMFHAVSAFCNAGISTLSGNMYDPLVADKYNLHFWIAMLIIFGGLGFPIVFNYLKLFLPAASPYVHINKIGADPLDKQGHEKNV